LPSSSNSRCSSISVNTWVRYRHESSPITVTSIHARGPAATPGNSRRRRMPARPQHTNTTPSPESIGSRPESLQPTRSSDVRAFPTGVEIDAARHHRQTAQPQQPRLAQEKDEQNDAQDCAEQDSQRHKQDAKYDPG